MSSSSDSRSSPTWPARRHSRHNTVRVLPPDQHLTESPSWASALASAGISGGVLRGFSPYAVVSPRPFCLRRFFWRPRLHVALMLVFSLPCPASALRIFRAPRGSRGEAKDRVLTLLIASSFRRRCALTRCSYEVSNDGVPRLRPRILHRDSARGNVIQRGGRPRVVSHAL